MGGIGSEEADEISALDRLRHNETIKYIAASLDRASTGMILGGFVGVATYVVAGFDRDPHPLHTVLALTILPTWVGAGFFLHWAGRRVLRNLI